MTEPQERGAGRGSLSWGIRDSLLRYVTVIARGSCTVTGPAGVEDGAFVFPLRSAARDGDEWRLAFAGSVHLTAHHGFLDVTIADPELSIGAGGGILTVRTGPEGAPRVSVAATAGAVPESGDSGHLWTAVPAYLLRDATELFGGVYEAGADMAPLTVHAPSLLVPLHS